MTLDLYLSKLGLISLNLLEGISIGILATSFIIIPSIVYNYTGNYRLFVIMTIILGIIEMLILILITPLLD